MFARFSLANFISASHCQLVIVELFRDAYQLILIGIVYED